MRDEEKKQLKEEIAYFFKEEYELDLGYIAQENILDFFLDNLGKKVYNEALDDAKRFYQRQAENMVSDYYVLYKN